MRRLGPAPSSVEDFKNRRNAALAGSQSESEGKPKPDEDACMTAEHDHDTHRGLALYQSLLVLLIIVAWVWYIGTHQMFAVHNSTSQLIPKNQKGVKTSVPHFATAFQVPKGSPKGTPPGDPDLVFFTATDMPGPWFGSEEGDWVWSHGELYLMLPTAMLHAISGTLMDPVYFTTALTLDPASHAESECFETGGDKVKCVTALFTQYLDPKKPPKGGYFAFVTRTSMNIFRYQNEYGIEFVPVTAQEVYNTTLMLVISTLFTAIVGATALTIGVSVTLEHVHKKYLKEYIAKGMFMQNDEHHRMYDEVLEEVHDEHHAEEAQKDEHDKELEMEHGEGDVHDDHPAIDKANKKIHKKLRARIHETQSVLHVVGAYATGGKPKKAPKSPDLSSGPPGLCSQLVTRTIETVAHSLLMIFTCLPILIANELFKKGLDEFGVFALNSGMLPPHSVVTYFHLFMLISSVIGWVLLTSLIIHYISHEFHTSNNSFLTMLADNALVKFFFTTWSGFQYLQMTMLWLSAVMIFVFALMGAMGLILHLFTNMFMVTGIIGTVTTMYFQYLFFAGILHEVYGEIHHAQIIMDDLVDALSKRLMALRLKKPDPSEPEEKRAKAKKKRKNMQKAILMVQSGFSNCVTHELQEAGFGPKDFLINLSVALAGAAVIITIIYSGMKAAHQFGKAVQAAGSALAGGAFAVMNSSKEKPKKKGPPEFPPKIQLAIDSLNEALQLTVHDSVSDLVYMLRHDKHCVEIVTSAIQKAEADMEEEKEDAWAQKNAQAFIKTARDGLKEGKKRVKKHEKEKALKEAAAQAQ